MQGVYTGKSRTTPSPSSNDPLFSQALPVGTLFSINPGPYPTPSAPNILSVTKSSYLKPLSLLQSDGRIST